MSFFKHLLPVCLLPLGLLFTDCLVKMPGTATVEDACVSYIYTTESGYADGVTGNCEYAVELFSWGGDSESKVGVDNLRQAYVWISDSGDDQMVYIKTTEGEIRDFRARVSELSPPKDAPADWGPNMQQMTDQISAEDWDSNFVPTVAKGKDEHGLHWWKYGYQIPKGLPVVVSFSVTTL